MVAFAQAVILAKFLQVSKKRLVAATVRDTVEYLYQYFRAALRDDPRRDQYESLLFFLEKTFKGYANEDPGVKQQKDLPIIVLLKVINLAQT